MQPSRYPIVDCVLSHWNKFFKEFAFHDSHEIGYVSSIGIYTAIKIYPDTMFRLIADHWQPINDFITAAEDGF